MAENSRIAWTDHTFNPWMGCQKVSRECDHCYAETLTTNRMGLDLWGGHSKRKRTSKGLWSKIRTFNRIAAGDRRPRRVFCASLADVFEDAPGPNEWRADVWDLIRDCPWLDFQLLTKRPENIAAMLPDNWGAEGWPHVWLGTSIGSREHVDRAQILTAVPAIVHFISYEPALGPLFAPDLQMVTVADASGMPMEIGEPLWGDGFEGDELDLTHIEWLICGGESGPGHRPMDLSWARDARAACDDAGVAFFFKQISTARPGQGEDALGEIMQQLPAGWDRCGLTAAAV